MNSEDKGRRQGWLKRAVTRLNRSSRLESVVHAWRIARQARAVGNRLGLAPAALRQVFVGALLHDVGKFFVPSRILNKPGRLSDTEWGVVRRHPLRGARLVRLLPGFPAGVVRVVLHHHERWDGGGYPHGLRGDQIPLPAQIVAVCDVYDALRSERPYKPAWDHARACAELSAQADRQFSRQVVDAFLAGLSAA